MRPAIERIREVWRHYAANKALPEQVLRAPVQRAWQRCDLAGASPHTMHATALPAWQMRTLFAREHDLIEASQPYMAALSRAAGGHRHAAMLGSAEAVVLDVTGDDASLHGPEAVPGPGAELGEGLAGANGIGSPLAEGGYIELVGPEHFIEGFHPSTCQGLPLTSPSGETIGVISTSLRCPEASARIREILISAAHGIEAELVRRRLEGDVQRLLARHGEKEFVEALLLEGLWEDVTQLQGSARTWLERAVHLAGSDRVEDARRLLAFTGSLIARFNRQSELWRQIVSAETGTAQFVDLRAQAERIADLLAREAAVRGVEIEVAPGPPVRVHAEPHELLRMVFRTFLRALDQVPARSTLTAQVVADDAHRLGVLRLPAVPEACAAVPQRPINNLH